MPFTEDSLTESVAATVETWLHRAKHERDELMTRLTKLVAFMKSPALRELHVQDQIDLRSQVQAMTSYASDLSRRIARHEGGAI